MAKNDITGDEIKSKSFSAKGRENYDRIYAKKTAHQWLEADPTVIMHDPDGWRCSDGVTMDTPITYSEYVRRLQYCTIQLKLENCK
jgi:hypothetical protein